jgi:hypothetical protein
MEWYIEIRYNGARLGTMQVPSYEDALSAAKGFGGLHSEIRWDNGTDQFSNNDGYSIIIWPAA